MPALLCTLLLGLQGCATSSGGGISGGKGRSSTQASAPIDPQIIETARIVDARSEDLSALVQLSASPKVEVRLQVARGLGRLQSTDAIPLLASLSEDPDPSVRYEALFALGQIDREESARILTARFDTEKDLRLRAMAIDSLGRVGGKETASLLIEALESDDATLAAQAATAAGIQAYRKKWEGEGAQFNTALSGALNHAIKTAPPEVKRAACFAYTRGLPSDEATDRTRAILLGALSDDSPQVREAAVLALSKIGTPKDGMAVAQLLVDPQWKVQVSAIRALSKLLTPSEAWLLRPALDDANPLVKESAINALGSLKAPDAVEWLQPFLTSSSISLSTSALDAIVSIKGDDAIDLLERTGGDDSPWLRAQAAASLGSLASPAAARVLVARARYELDPRVMVQVASSLGEVAQAGIEDPDPIVAMEEMLLRGDPATATVVATVLAELGQINAIPPLIQAYKRQRPGKDYEAQVAIIDAFKTLKGPESLVRGVLEDALEDPNPQVSQAAADALKSLFNIESDPLLTASPIYPLSARAYGEILQVKRAWVETSRGTIVLDLFPDLAPVTVSNFKRLADQGFYDGLTWHRVVPNFVVQTGSPRGDGWGGPGYAIRCEVAPEVYSPGTLGMALSGKDTGGSQFFITHTHTPHLEGTYTIFGRVQEGMDVVDSLLRGDTIQSIRFSPVVEEDVSASDPVSPF